MDRQTRTRFITSIDADQIVTVRAPFSAIEENRRKFIRLEVGEPICFELIKERGGRLHPAGDGAPRNGATLNLSAGGMLIDTATPTAEGSLVALTVTLQGSVKVENILAVVKRVDFMDDIALMGVEFVAREALSDTLSAAELTLLDGKYNQFEWQVRRALSSYVNFGASAGSKK